jgi:hypothetical protein
MTENTKSSEIAVQEESTLMAASHPDDFTVKLQQFRVLAEAVISGKLAPKGMQTADQVMIAMQTGSELGLPPMRSLSCIMVINGRPGLLGEAALGLLRSKGALEPGTDLQYEFKGETGGAWVNKKEEDSLACHASLHRRGQPEPFEVKFSVPMAKKAKLWGKPGPWTDYPQRMLMWRAVGYLLRDHFSDVLLGLPLEEELRDIPTAHVPARAGYTQFAEPETGPDPLLQGVVDGTIDPATEMEILPPPETNSPPPEKE